MKNSMKLCKNFGFAGIALCAACCALPMVGVVLGAGSLAVLSRYVEWAGIAVLVLALVFFGVYFFKKRNAAQACDIDCSCKSGNDLVSQQKKRMMEKDIPDLTIPGNKETQTAHGQTFFRSLERMKNKGTAG